MGDVGFGVLAVLDLGESLGSNFAVEINWTDVRTAFASKFCPAGTAEALAFL